MSNRTYSDGDLIEWIEASPEEAACEISELRAEVERLREYLEASRLVTRLNRKDAERYRWLRDYPWVLQCDSQFRSIIQWQKNALWDKAIDAAMGEGSDGKT